MPQLISIDHHIAIILLLSLDKVDLCSRKSLHLQRAAALKRILEIIKTLATAELKIITESLLLLLVE